uniref:Neuropeptide receptor 15 n=1 Tax=Caenorhabditis elegans TaxID=6239 RepID=NPR15_CAEEL|nr:RecName: Full=Neuropeptide receptor 15 [Caenorhabditis elegans]|eukprot:NP_497744.2 Neuropeptide receptor 15 [Caenorhabditis elegans]
MSVAVGIPYVCFFIILSVVGIIGNVIVIYAIAGDRNMRKSVMNILLLNLAVADLANLIFTIPEWIPPVFFGSTDWLFPSFLCPVCRYLECVFLFASISTQMIVCIERYIAIVLPMQARQLCSRRNVLITVLVDWIFVACFASPYAVWHSVKTKDRNTNSLRFKLFQLSATCSNTVGKSTWWQGYKLTEFLAFYFVPCFIITVVYTKVAKCLWCKDPTLQCETRSCLDNKSSSRSSDALRTRRNVVKMLIACVAVYFVCYSPIQVIFLSKAVLNVTIHPPYDFILLMNALAMTCSASNPLLYTLFSQKFRRRLRDVLYCPSDVENETKTYYSINNTSIVGPRASFN